MSSERRPPRVPAPRKPLPVEDPTDQAGLDRDPPGQRPYTGTDADDPPLTVRAQVRIAVGGHADAVIAAQGHALRGLLAALTGTSAPDRTQRQDNDDDRT